MSLIVRVVAPIGRDAELIVGVLKENGIAAEVCASVEAILDEHGDEPLGPMLLAEECLTPPTLKRLADRVHQQPPWSDFQILILTTGGRQSLRSQRLVQERQGLGSPVLLERPIRTETLLSSVRAAVRARARQYEVRDALVERDRVLDELRTERDVLRNSEERFRRLIENASIGINITDVYGHITYANPTMLKLVGYSMEDVREGKIRWDDLTPDEFLEADRHATQQLLATGTCEPYQKAYRARDGRLVPVLVGATLIPSSESSNREDQVAVFLTDLTSQKLAETALIQSEKLAAVGRLAASISHEINNPLEAVTNLLYLIRKEPELLPHTKNYLLLAESELARVSQIAAQTLRFHRQSTKAQAVTPSELIDSVVSLYQGRLANSGIEVVHDHGFATAVTCYEGDIRQVLNNLVGNAIDSMRTGGKLVVRTRNAMCWKDGREGVRITIADTGHGMSRAVARRIFEAFYTTKGLNGTGLGLWISHGIVEKHHGRLDVRSKDNGAQTGTVFSLFLPRQLEVQEAASGK